MIGIVGINRARFFFSCRTNFQEETHVQRDGHDVDHQTDQSQADIPATVADRRGCCQKIAAQSAVVPVPAVGAPFQTVHVLSPSRLQIPPLPSP